VIAKKGRRDHYLPQGYMRGFIDPARENLPQPLWHLDIPYQRWSMRSTKQIGHDTGFYDYAGTAPELDSLESADDAFRELENDFPRIRGRLLAKHFRNWHKHLGLLLRYMQMIRARSPLFFAQKEDEGKALQTWTAKDVHADVKTLTLTSMEPAPPPAPFLKNRTITQMREEIQKGGSWLWDFNWALRFCDSVAEPFITSEAPLVAEGPATEISQALQHPETLLFFPLCWQACLIGSLQRFDLGTAKFSSEDMRTFRMKYRRFAQVFLISPAKLDDISAPV
jgi:Protein of unknown function (DUF4238)